MVLVVPHDPAWAPAFERIRARLLEGFAGPPFSEVAHIDLLLGRRNARQRLAG